MNEKLKLENQLCFPLYACAKEIVRRYTPLLDPLGLTYTQYIAMMVIWEHKSISVKGEELHEKAAEIPTKMAGCVTLENDEALQLYSLLHKMMKSF